MSMMDMRGGGPPGQGTAGGGDIVSTLKGITQQLASLVRSTRTSSGNGQVTALNSVGATFTQVIAANPQRFGITFHNPGTVNLYVGPMTLANGSNNTPTLGALGGTYVIFPGAVFVLGGQLAYGAMAASGSANPITITES